MYSGMRRMHRENSSSVGQLPVPTALNAHTPTLFLLLYCLYIVSLSARFCKTNVKKNAKSFYRSSERPISPISRLLNSSAVLYPIRF